MLKFLGSAVVTVIAIILLLPLKDGANISAAARNSIVDQIPPAIDILAQRHPFKIGIARAALNQDGRFDSLAQSYLGASIDQEMNQSPSLLRSYGIYYAVLFDKQAVRTKIADTIEQQFGLND